MKIRSLLALLLLPVCFNALGKVETYIVSPEASLTLPVANQLEEQNVVQLRSFLVQGSNWSCGLHTAFHTLAVEEALKDPDNFEQVLKQKLQDRNFLADLDKRYGNNKALYNSDIERIGQDFDIKNKMIFLHADINHRIKYLGKITYPGHASQAEKDSIFEQTKNGKLQELIDLVKNAPQAVYIVASADDHWVLFALVNLPHKPAKLYFIDSNNNSLDRKPKWHLFVNLLSPYLKEINKGIPAQPAKPSSDLSSAVTAHLVNKIKPSVIASPAVKPTLQDTPAVQAPQIKPAVKHIDKSKQVKKYPRRKIHRKHRHKRKHARKRRGHGCIINPALLGLWHQAKQNRKSLCHQKRACPTQSPRLSNAEGRSCPFAWALYQKHKRKC